VVLSQRVRLGRTQDTPRIERLYFGELLRSQQTDSVPVTRTSPSPNTSRGTNTATSPNIGTSSLLLLTLPFSDPASGPPRPDPAHRLSPPGAIAAATTQA